LSTCNNRENPMDTSPPNNEAPATGKSRASSKTNLNNDTHIVAEVPQERKCNTVVFDRSNKKFWVKNPGGSWSPRTKAGLITHIWCEGGTKSEAIAAVEKIQEESQDFYAGTLAGQKAGLCDYMGSPILVTKDSPPLIDGRFPAVERADFSGHTLDADRRDHGFEASYARAVRGGRSYRKRKSKKGRSILLGIYRWPLGVILRPQRLFFLCRCGDVHSVPATSSCAIRCPNNQKEYAVKLAASEAEKQTILTALNRWSGGTGIIWSSGAEVL
jgi:hypothetical protein